MVSSDLWTDIVSRLKEIFMMISEKAFPGLTFMTVAKDFQSEESAHFHDFFIRIV